MLKAFFKENPSAAVAFSGGVDSAWLLFCAVKYGRDITAYFVKTEFQPEFELDDAKRLAADVGARLKIIYMSALVDEKVRANPQNRCYYCKTNVFSAIRRAAAEDGYSLLLDGSNMDDDPAQRPGMKALRELNVRSPLREAGLHKSDIRRLSREAGLFTWDKPSYSCLATRVPAGCEITGEILGKTERGEAALFELGFTDFRLRWRNGAAKLELPAEQLEAAIFQREKILAALGQDYPEITLDLKAR